MSMRLRRTVLSFAIVMTVSLLTAFQPAAQPSSTKGAPSSSRPEGAEPDKLEILRRRMDNLEARAADKNKPWYERAQTVIPICISIASLSISFYTVRNQNRQRTADELKKRTEALLATTVQLVETRSAFVQLTQSKENIIDFHQKSSLLNAKKQLLMQYADALMQGMERQVLPGIYNDLAFEAAADGNFEQAVQYCRRGLQSAHLDRSSTTALHRFLGELYMQPATPLHNLEEGRREFERAMERLKGAEDQYGLYLKVLTSLVRAGYESLNGNQSEAADVVKLARQEAGKLMPNTPLWQQCEQLVQDTERRLHAALAPRPIVLAPISSSGSSATSAPGPKPGGSTLV